MNSYVGFRATSNTFIGGGTDVELESEPKGIEVFEMHWAADSFGVPSAA
jgi:hypothetical protein